MKRVNRTNQKGVSIIAAIFIIVVLGFMGVMFVSMIGTSTLTSVNDLQSGQAFYIAEGGLERTVRFLDSPILTASTDSRGTCGSVSGVLTATSLGSGQFAVTANAAFNPGNPVTLSGIVGTTVNVNADPIVRGYAQSGRIMIDRELIDYSGTLGNSFTNVVRGRDGSVVSAHANGTPIGQYQCTATSTGGIPDLTSPSAQRTVSEGIQLQEGWVVGGGGLPNDNLNSVHCTGAANCWAVGDAGTILRWNGVVWSQVASPTGENLNEVHCADANNCWAVGNAGGVAAERPMLLRWDGATWIQYDSLLNINENLNSVFCVSANDCWAVGTDGGGASQQPLIFWWNGATWATRNSNLNIDNIDLSSVYCVSTNDCWAVGTDGAGAAQSPFIVWWNGATWATRNSNLNINNIDLSSVYCVSSNDCWAVGTDGAGAAQSPFIVWWNGATWATRNSNLNINNIDLSSVYCVSSNDCWAVGTDGAGAAQSPFIVWWNGATWATRNSNLNINVDLNDVYCSSGNDCWAVGNAGNIFHWNGAAWTPWQQANATLLRWRDTSWNDAVGLLPVGVNRLRSVSMLSYADVWAAGDRRGCAAAGPTIVRWNGGVNWTCTTGVLATPDQNLRSISMISSTDGWAVGNSNGARPSAIRWNTPCGGGAGTGTWNDCTNAAYVPAVNQPLRSVSMLSSADGWAVGSRSAGTTNGWLFMRWNNPAANTWNRIIVNTAPTIAQNLNAVYLVSANDGWAVGNRIANATNGWTFFRWGGVTWNRVAVTTAGTNARNLNSVFMLDTDSNGTADDGWAVGDSNGARPVVLRWNVNCNGVGATGTWNGCTNAPYVPAINQNLNWVFMVGADDGWAAGDGGLLLHWDGIAWAQVASQTGQNLDGIYFIGPRQRPQAAWQEVIQ